MPIQHRGKPDFILHLAERRNRDDLGNPLGDAAGNDDFAAFFAFRKIPDLQFQPAGLFLGVHAVFPDQELEIPGEFGPENNALFNLPKSFLLRSRRNERDAQRKRSGQLGKGRKANRRQFGSVCFERSAEQIDAIHFSFERKRESDRQQILRREIRMLRPGVDVGNTPVDQHAAAVLPPVEIAFETLAEIDLPFQRGIAEPVGQSRQGCISRLHGEVMPHQPPILLPGIFVIGRHDEEEIAGDAERLHLDHHLRQILGNQELLVGRVPADTGQAAFLFADAFHIGTVFGVPDRAAGNPVTRHVSPDITDHGREIPDNGISVHVEDVEIIPSAIPHDDIAVIRQGGLRITAQSHGLVRISRLEPETGGFQRGGVIPGAFRGEPDVLFIPEFPGGHLSLKMFR